MKLSSASLIVAAIASIVDSAIAAPVALHARDLEEVNPFYSRESGVADVGSARKKTAEETAGMAR